MTLNAAITLLLVSAVASAADSGTPSLKVTPTGRVLIDGALYASPQKEYFSDGMAIPEVRLGANARYENWSAGIDVSYAYSKIGLRNMWIQYNFSKENALRIGNFIHQYGLQSTSGSTKCTMEQPIASALYTPGLQLGAMFTHYDPRFYTAVSAHVESSALKEVMNAPLFCQQGYAVLTRLVWRRQRVEGKVIQAGISGGFGTPQRRVADNHDIHDGFTISANFPTKVTQLTAVGTTVTDSKNLFKFTPEILLTCGRMAFEGQYFFQQINRRNGLHAFRSQSGYATLRGLLIGKGYAYSSSTAQIARPAGGSLECVLDYNHAKLSDASAGIFGGRSNSFSATLNWYINPYITARLNFSHTHRWDKAEAPSLTMNAVQARLMLLF